MSINGHRMIRVTAFQGERVLLAGPLTVVALAVKAALAKPAEMTVLTFDDVTGKVIDLDLRGADADIVLRLTPAEDMVPAAQANSDAAPPVAPRGRGRPKLGVVAREVTLLPRHWEWLAGQPGGASVMLRRLVDEARRNGEAQTRIRASREAAYRFMSAMAGDRPGFEEATRALFAGDGERFALEMAGWPDDIRAYALRIVAGPDPLDPET